MLSLEERWLSLCKRVRAKGNHLVLLQDLLARYGETHRAYHTLLHIETMLEEFEEVRHLAEDPDSIEFAIWYHDIIYDTNSKDNEYKSAFLFLSMASYTDLLNIRANGTAMIMATTHKSILITPDSRIICDLDLAILGQPKERFDEYESQIREEYWWVGEIAFVKGRVAVLESFLPPKRAHVYLTKYFREKYEKQAIKNIERSIAQLQSRRL